MITKPMSDYILQGNILYYLGDSIGASIAESKSKFAVHALAANYSSYSM